jgi:probable HAF family extracellular repeat protein
MRQVILLVALSSMLVGAAFGQVNPSGSTFQFRTIDFPGALTTQAFGINERGDVVGDYTDTSGNVHGFLLKKGKFSSIDYPGAILTSARGINDAGEIVGAFSTADDPQGAHGYLLRNGIYTQRDFPGAVHTAILGVNESGNVTGSYDLGDITTGIGFFTNGERFISFEVPGSFPKSTGPHGINDNVQLIGFYEDALDTSVTHGFLLDHAKFASIDYPGAGSTALFGINEHGEVAGSCQCNDGSNHSFVFANGKFTVLSYPGSGSITKAKGINDRDEVVGFYQPGRGEPTHGFVATVKHQGE